MTEKIPVTSPIKMEFKIFLGIERILEFLRTCGDDAIRTTEPMLLSVHYSVSTRDGRLCSSLGTQSHVYLSRRWLSKSRPDGAGHSWSSWRSSQRY